MKKLYNKALMYQSFYIGKWALLLSCFLFGFICYEKTSYNLSHLRNSISTLQDNQYLVINYDIRVFSWVLLLLMYIIITGINKKNNLIFLTSGPYTKSEIKKNEILFLFISLCAFIAVFCYISICIYYRDIELINLSHGFLRETLKEVVKLFVCGLAFISYLSIMDSLFANICITVFLMLSTPFILLLDLALFQSSLSDLRCSIIYDNKIINTIMGVIDSIGRYVCTSINNYGYSTWLITLLILAGTMLFFILTKYAVKKLTINNTNKFFNFPLVEDIFMWCLSITIMLMCFCIVINAYDHHNGIYYSEVATFSFKGILYIIALFATSYIVKRIISKQIKKII